MLACAAGAGSAAFPDCILGVMLCFAGSELAIAGVLSLLPVVRAIAKPCPRSLPSTGWLGRPGRQRRNSEPHIEERTPLLLPCCAAAAGWGRLAESVVVALGQGAADEDADAIGSFSITPLRFAAVGAM